MTRPVIVAEGLVKEYRLGEYQPYKSLRESLSSLVGMALKPRQPNETIRALDDLCLAVEAGEVLGLIGRNGAGKTTLLKVLSRITHPTHGRVEIEGRVGSLLEVGTGFHPELTGRENVYLNGAILGMKRVEILHRFDDIVEFAEVARFIDTPVKRYSSGMYLRLAFSVAAHLFPDILLVDEVLAVGDQAFQKKCLGKMGEVGAHGRTVVLVSHNLVAVQSLCSRVAWIDRGRLRGEGDPQTVVEDYLKSVTNDVAEVRWDDIRIAPGSSKVRLHKAAVRPEGDGNADRITMITPVELEVEFWNLAEHSQLGLSVHLINSHGITVFNTTTVEEPSWQGKPFPKGRFRSVCRIPGRLLNHGVFSVTLLVVEDEGVVLSRHKDLLTFEVHDSPELRSKWYGLWEGVVHPSLAWHTELLDSLNQPEG